MTESDDVKKPEKGVSKGLLIALAIAFLITAGLVAFLTYNAVHDFTVSFEMANLPGIAIKETTPQPGTSEPGTENELQVPLQPDSGPVPPAWDGAKRVTILVMGLDYRDWEAGNGPPRTDTMVLLTVDPLTRTTGMLSIPRDLWVNIPGGFNYGRINTAYQLGETYKYPEGGGPGLAMATVEELLGVPIDYYAQVDFQAFEDLINTIGGIDIDVAKKIKVDPLGDNNNRTIKKGLQHLNGKLALAYARTRHTEGDRSSSQQNNQHRHVADFDCKVRYPVQSIIFWSAYQPVSGGSDPPGMVGRANPLGE
jgi:LCP family protein required for cell wall assembly